MPEKDLRELLDYPERGDMRTVRPRIRAEEMAIQSFETHIGHTKLREPWVQSFWQQNLKMSRCFLLITGQSASIMQPTTTQAIDDLYDALISHFFRTVQSTGIDAKHDTVFGTALYALSIIRELMQPGASQSVISRSALRTLMEAYVTLSYLMFKNNADLWRSHRIFGAGQAKLSSLKIDEFQLDQSFVNPETLKQICNEDMWEEFLPINLGHWENSNLRREAVEAQVKDDYDRYYGWTSSYTHAHWGAIRATVFENCGNPLHRFHRVPLPAANTLPDVLPDACRLADKILAIVSEAYPVFSNRICNMVSEAERT